MNLHVIAGLPRSGSTLIANALAQHPDVHVSGTSALPNAVGAVSAVMTNSPEATAMLANEPGTTEAYAAALRGLIEGWYSTRDEPVIIDKSRGWAQHALLLAELYPDAKIIVCVRDPRDVVASIERQHRRTAVFASPLAPTLYEAAETAMTPDGLVGGPIRFCEDLLRRQLPNVMWVRYESLIVDPRSVIGDVYETVGLDGTCDVENIENQSPDLDALYRNKYPHDAAGAIKPTGTTWSDLLDPQLGAAIAGRYPYFMEAFRYPL